MLRPLFLISSTCFWLVMTALLIQREYFQLTPVGANYEILPIEMTSVREEYQGITMGPDRIGFNFTVLATPKDPKEKNTFHLRHTTYLSFLFLGKKREMLIVGKARLNRQLHLKSFKVKISSGDYGMALKGRIRKNVLRLKVDSGEETPRIKEIPLHGPVFYSESTNFIWTPENLKLGKQGQLEVFNPVIMNFQKINFQVKEKATIDYQGKPTEVFVVHMSSSGIETRSWISHEGVVLKAESPTGFSLQKEEGWQIFDGMRARKSALPDLPNLFSVPSNIEIENPMQTSYLKAQLKTPDQEKTVEIQKSSTEGLEKIPLPVPLAGQDFSKYLESTAWLQVADPEIQKASKEAVAGSAGALEALNRLVDWVHQTVSPVPTLSFPNAKEILQVKKGDCNEYTALFTALARATGIPTRMIAGLVYQKGRFFYHAWPEVYIGRWIMVDPTFGQHVADATHIPLIEGNMEEQLALVSQIGRIKIFVLESK